MRITYLWSNVESLNNSGSESSGRTLFSQYSVARFNTYTGVRPLFTSVTAGLWKQQLLLLFSVYSFFKFALPLDSVIFPFQLPSLTLPWEVPKAQCLPSVLALPQWFSTLAVITTSGVRPKAWTNLKSSISNSDTQLDLRASSFLIL